MAVPSISSLSPSRGATSGGDLVRVTGAGLAPAVSVSFGGAEAKVLRVVRLDSRVFIDVLTPPHAPGLVGVMLWNLDAQGQPIATEWASSPESYRYVRGPLVTEAVLTRAVRTLLQDLKRDVLQNTSITVSVDYQPPSDDDASTVVLASLPSLVISGPIVRENRFYRAYEPRERLTMGRFGREVVRHRAPFTADLGFTITGASSSTAELLNLMSAVVTFISTRSWLEMERDPADASKGRVRWELHIDGEVRSRLHGSSGVRVFTAGLEVRGFDIHEGMPLDRARRVDEVAVRAAELSVETNG